MLKLWGKEVRPVVEVVLAFIGPFFCNYAASQLPGIRPLLPSGLLQP